MALDVCQRCFASFAEARLHSAHHLRNIDFYIASFISHSMLNIHAQAFLQELYVSVQHKDMCVC